MNKKKLVAIGVNSKTQKCCCIYSYATFEQLKENYNLYAKNYTATNWGGCDYIYRTLELEKKHLTGRKFFKTVEIEGDDPDMGHSYPWRFVFDVVMEVKQGSYNNSAVKED